MLAANSELRAIATPVRQQITSDTNVTVPISPSGHESCVADPKASWHVPLRVTSVDGTLSNVKVHFHRPILTVASSVPSGAGYVVLAVVVVVVVVAGCEMEAVDTNTVVGDSVVGAGVVSEFVVVIKKVD